MNKLKKYRKAAGLTQGSLAAACGTSKRNISALERGERDLQKVAAGQLLKIATILGVPLEELLKDENE